jgi:hypothetical protein
MTGEVLAFWLTLLESGAYEPGVKGTGEGYVGCALNEGAAIGEKRDGVGRSLKTEKEVVEADGAVGRETVAHSSKVYRAMVFVNLN